MHISKTKDGTSLILVLLYERPKVALYTTPGQNFSCSKC